MGYLHHHSQFKTQNNDRVSFIISKCERSKRLFGFNTGHGRRYAQVADVDRQYRHEGQIGQYRAHPI
jgi:hypothetical protein